MKEPTLFDFEENPISINKPIRLIELFAGYGSQSMAMERIGVKFETYKAVEFDSHACNLFNNVHNTNFPVLDITKINATDLEIVDRDKYEYIMFYSYPCTDISLAGQQKGMAKGSGTRSALIWEVERLLNELNGNLPQILMMENVGQVISKKNMEDFRKWLTFLASLGYKNFYQILNTKDFGIPQNRERCFMISVLGDYTYDFPEEIPLEYCMADILESEVDDKYFVNNEKADKLIEQLIMEKKLPDLHE